MRTALACCAAVCAASSFSCISCPKDRIAQLSAQVHKPMPQMAASCQTALLFHDTKHMTQRTPLSAALQWSARLPPHLAKPALLSYQIESTCQIAASCKTALLLRNMEHMTWRTPLSAAWQ